MDEALSKSRSLMTQISGQVSIGASSPIAPEAYSLRNKHFIPLNSMALRAWPTAMMLGCV